jgi:hypothetical protein
MTRVNTFLRKYQLIFNRLKTPNARCSGVYAVLAIEHQGQLQQEWKAPHTPEKNPGYLIFNI